MRIRLYLDEDAMDDALVNSLRARLVDVETADEARMRGREDHEHLAYATAQARVVYTFNAGHFCALHADLLRSSGFHAGIVVCPQQRYSVGEQMRRLLSLLARLSAEEMQNRLEFLSDWAPTANLRPPHLAPCSPLLATTAQSATIRGRPALGAESVMATVTDIGTLIEQTPGIRDGRPCIAGTGVSVLRIAGWYKMGLSPEEISRTSTMVT